MTDETKYTPGPWEAEYGADGYYYVTHDGGVELRNETEANARLISNAPELLEALKNYMLAVDQMNCAMRDGVNVHGALSMLSGSEDMANWVIAKAEGRSA